MKNISANITYHEATLSTTAMRLGIDNTPNQEQLDNMNFLAEVIFENLRIMGGDRPIRITSFFRSKALNKAIGGSATSQHICLNDSAAMDLDNDNVQGLTNYEIFSLLKKYFYFDQLIWEFGTDQMPDWVHVSIRTNPIKQNRQEVLRAVKRNGKTIYIPA